MLEALLAQPGLDFQVVACLGPTSFHRFSGMSQAFRQIPAPEEVWSKLGQEVTEKFGGFPKAAFELLKSTESVQVRRNTEYLLDQLFILTADAKITTAGNCPEHNLLDFAVTLALRPLIPLLLMRGYVLEMLDAYSLESFIQRDKYDDVAAYLEAGISPEIRCNAGRSALMVAVAFKSYKVTRLLLEWNADVHQCSGFGQWTALMWAAHVGWEDGCNLLLEMGARLDNRNSGGQTALDIARSQKHVAVETLLRSRT